MKEKKVVKAIIIKNDKYLFIKRRGASKFFPNTWDFPGGKVKKKEELLDAMEREVLEETSLNIVVGELVKEISHSEQDTIFHFSFFSIKEFSGEVKLSEDHTDSIWLSEEELKGHELATGIQAYFDTK